MTTIEIGQKYGKLTVQKFVKNNKRGDRLWFLSCECGGDTIVKTGNLTSGKTKSCGCIKPGQKIKNLIGEKFTRLIVVDYSHTGKWRDTWWVCECNCGKIIQVSRPHLFNGHVKSCGCLKIEIDKSRKGKNNPNYNLLLTDEKRKIGRNYKEYREWNLKVKIKANFCCDICEKIEKGMVAHHLESYQFNENLRTNIDNGVCLCKQCHLLFHNKYSRKNNTKQQFLKFKEEICQPIQ